MGVQMQSPISDYGNFGENIANSWNQAQERGLKLKMHEDEIAERSREFDENLAFNEGVATGMIKGEPTLAGQNNIRREYEFNYLKKRQQAFDDLEKHQLETKYEQDQLAADYRNITEAGTFGEGQEYKYEPGFWHEPLTWAASKFGYEPTTTDPSKVPMEDWARQSSREVDYRSYKPEDVYQGLAEKYYTEPSYWGSPGSSDEELFSKLSFMDLLGNVPYNASGVNLTTYGGGR